MKYLIIYQPALALSCKRASVPNSGPRRRGFDLHKVDNFYRYVDSIK